MIREGVWGCEESSAFLAQVDKLLGACTHQHVSVR
jgi:hypothetical protein